MFVFYWKTHHITILILGVKKTFNEDSALLPSLLFFLYGDVFEKRQFFFKFLYEMYFQVFFSEALEVVKPQCISLRYLFIQFIAYNHTALQSFNKAL